MYNMYIYIYIYPCRLPGHRLRSAAGSRLGDHLGRQRTTTTNNNNNNNDDNNNVRARSRAGARIDAGGLRKPPACSPRRLQPNNSLGRQMLPTLTYSLFERVELDQHKFLQRREITLIKRLNTNCRERCKVVSHPDELIVRGNRPFH